MEIRVRSIEEAELHVQSLTIRVTQLEDLIGDHVRRWDTLQTPWWKRVWFWINGWPWYNLNAGRPHHRPWHRWLRP
jgi:hypothetical protein